jgi:acetyl-CoA carboxylase biotin carboxyl carrier protein
MARERGGEAGHPPERPAGQSLSIAEVRQLIALMQNSDLEEIAVEREAEGLKLSLRKPAPISATLSGGMGDVDLHGLSDVVEATGSERGDDHQQDHRVPVGAPLVGRFHFGLKPKAKPLVAVGDVVREGQVLGAIETLNVLNEVEASQPGRIVEVLVSEGQAVEYGQPLMLIEPLTP